jgi:hypothetical protein
MYYKLTSLLVKAMINMKKIGTMAYSEENKALGLHNTYIRKY